MAESKEMGEQRCVTWRRTRADAWTRDWRKMKDAELDLSAAQHVEARGSRRGAQQLGSGAQAIVAGNAAVDLRAKAGAEMGANFGKQEAVNSLSERARRAAQNAGWGRRERDGDWPDVARCCRMLAWSAMAETAAAACSQPRGARGRRPWQAASLGEVWEKGGREADGAEAAGVCLRAAAAGSDALAGDGGLFLGGSACAR